MQIIFLLLTVCLTALLGSFYPATLPWLSFITFMLILYLLWQEKHKGFQPQSKTYKTLEKIKKKRHKIDNNKHKHITDQIGYIAQVWGYTISQERIIEKFLKGRVYSKLYNTLTASLLPQIITLIDNCNAREQKGCKRQVAKRLRALTALMKEELKKKNSQIHEDFETTLEVYDQLFFKR